MDRAETQDNYKKDNKALRSVIFITKLSKIKAKMSIDVFSIQTNNRPISLLPVLSKVSEKIALNQFTDYLTQQGNLTCHQSGNRKFHSTEILSLLVTGHIYKAMDKK